MVFLILKIKIPLFTSCSGQQRELTRLSPPGNGHSVQAVAHGDRTASGI